MACHFRAPELLASLADDLVMVGLEAYGGEGRLGVEICMGGHRAVMGGDGDRHERAENVLARAEGKR